MDQDKQIQQQGNQQGTEIVLRKSLIGAMVAGDKLQVSTILREYKTPQGVIKFDKVLAIPITERIPALAKEDFSNLVGIITAALTLAFEGMNLKRGMNAIQTLDLAEAVIDTAGEDNLAMEDLMLFLQKLVRGEYGAMYESMDIPKFMTAFEEYRETRWQQLNNIRYEQAAQYKGMGDTERSNQTDELSEHFAKMADTMSRMSSELKATRKENIELKKNI